MIGRILFAGLLALCAHVARAAVLDSSDQAFTVNLPGGWKTEKAGPGVVLQAKKGPAKIKVRTQDEVSSAKAAASNLKASFKALRKARAKTTGKVYSAKLPSGGSLLFVQFTFRGERTRSGFFDLGGRWYGIQATNFSNADFKALVKSLSPAPKPAEPPPRPPAAAMAASSDTLAAPPAGAFATAQAEAPKELTPLPQRDVGGSLYLFLIAVAVSAAALGYRVFARHGEEQEEPPAPGSAFPFHIERHYFSFPIVFDVQDAAGQRYRGVSQRIPALFLGAGVGCLFLAKVVVQGASFMGTDIKSFPIFVLGPIVLMATLSNLLIILGAVLLFFFRKRLRVYDSAGSLILDVRQQLVSLFSLYFIVRDSNGNQLAKIRRKGFVLIRRRWQLLDLSDKILLDVVEDSAARAIARKLLGHLWGLLRTNYVISQDGSEAGHIRREWSIWNRYKLHLAPTVGLEPRLVLAAALFLDIVDPDRWHPWHG